MADQQPTTDFIAAPVTTPIGELSQQQKNDKMRAYIKNLEKRGSPHRTIVHNRPSRVSKSLPHQHQQARLNPNISIDDVIAFLCHIRDSGDYKAQKTLQERFTISSDEKSGADGEKKKKKELSAEKLEKIAKRKKTRAEKRKAKLAAREQGGAEGSGETSTVEIVRTESEVVAENKKEKEETKAADMHPDDLSAFEELDYED